MMGEQATRERLMIIPDPIINPNERLPVKYPPVSTRSFSSTHSSINRLKSRSDSDLKGGRNWRLNSDCGCAKGLSGVAAACSIALCGVVVVCSIDVVTLRISSSSGL